MRFMLVTFTVIVSQTFDSCIAAKEIQCPAGKFVDASVHSPQPICAVCAPGFYKATVSSGSTESDSCTAHSKCPPGKYTSAIGSLTTQPKCESCLVGFFKSNKSPSGTETDSCTAAEIIQCPMGKFIKATGTAQPTCESVSACPKCGTFKDSDKRSCCARGGAWFNKCGNDGDFNFDHTWFEGIQACKSKLATN